MCDFRIQGPGMFPELTLLSCLLNSILSSFLFCAIDSLLPLLTR